MTRAFAPGNISCLFKVIQHADPARMHSLGMGFTIREGVEVRVSESSEGAILFNRQSIDFPTVGAVVTQLTRKRDTPGVKVEIASPLPLGCGFGLSGAAALATAYALNKLLQMRKAPEVLAMIAHIAEVENHTGLGDVCSQYHGGCLVKLKEGAPLIADRLPIAEQPIYYRYFGPIQTSKVLRNREQTLRINQAADTALSRLQTFTDTKPSDELFNAYLEVSKQFAVQSGLLTDTRVIEAITCIEATGGGASMIMLGNGVFSTHPFENAVETRLVHNPARLIS